MRARLFVTLVLIYVMLVGATYSGILDPQFRLINALLVGVVLIVWWWSRRRWTWHRTPLDAAILVWCAAFAISLIANPDSWRRIVIGLWFMALYIGVWYLLRDAFANRALRREWLIDALLIAGVPVVFVGFAQVEVALTGGQPIPRPVGTLGNANLLASFLVLLMPFAIGRLLTAKSPLARVSLAAYGMAILALTALTYSRGGWIGMGVGLAVWFGLRFDLRRLWSAAPVAARVAVVIASVVGAAAVAYVIVQSLGIGGRGLELRTWIYQTALTMFGEHPLTGWGVFTFGEGLSRLNSLPPFEPHSHAHNVILNVAAELGIVGLLALALTAWAVVRAAVHVLRTHAVRDRDRVAIMGIAAFAGFAAHQMFDLPAMMPMIALTALIALAIATAPAAPIRTPDSARRAWQPAIIALGGVLLTIGGVWSALTYQTYVAVLSGGVNGGDYRAAAAELQPLADADPALGIYPQQQGMLLGIAAAEGDADAAPLAAEKFARYTTLEPDYVSGWANLAALQFALGDQQAAFAAMARAVDLAPRSWSLLYRYGSYAEAVGDPETARRAYEQALDLGTDIMLLPDWDTSPVRQSIPVDEASLSEFAQTIRLLERGETAAAQQIWQSSPGAGINAPGVHILNQWIAQTEGDPARAAAEYAAAGRSVVNRSGRIWMHLGAAFLDPAQFDDQIAAARAERDGAPFEPDWELGENIAYIQYLHLAIPRQFLPQVGFTEVEFSLLHLLGDDEALANLRATILR